MLVDSLKFEILKEKVANYCSADSDEMSRINEEIEYFESMRWGDYIFFLSELIPNLEEYALSLSGSSMDSYMLYKSYKYMPNNEKLYNQRAMDNLLHSVLSLDVEVSSDSKRSLYSKLVPICKIVEDSLISSDLRYHESIVDTGDDNIMKELIIIYKKDKDEPSSQMVCDIHDKIKNGDLKIDYLTQKYLLITITGRVGNR